MRTGGNLSPPSAPVVVLSSAPVPSLVSVTLAPVTEAPEASVTVPRMLPVSTWAWSRPGTAKNSRAAAAEKKANRLTQDVATWWSITYLLRKTRYAGSGIREKAPRHAGCGRRTRAVKQERREFIHEPRDRTPAGTR